MKPPTRIALRLASGHPISRSPYYFLAARQIHTTPSAPATVSPIHGTGPPPEAPEPAADSTAHRVERRKRQAVLLSTAQELRSAYAGGSKTNPQQKQQQQQHPLRKRFWKDVHVREVDGAWEVHLDARPLRHPTTKQTVRVPLSKPLLAGALAIEWDMLMSAQQATRQHLIPLTSLVCRALDIAEDDALSESSKHGGARVSIRVGITKTVLRYLDTDSLLCWAPPRSAQETAADGQRESLRDLQQRTAEEIVGFLTSRVWPGIEIQPVLDGESIMPKGQSQITRQVVEGWIMGLSSWELAGLERGVLAGKGLLGAVRLLVEWSEGSVGAGIGDGAGSEAEKTFGVEEAARVASLEVDWQTGRWGEVEDTHDVEKEDLRRQLGSLVLLVSGTGRR